MSELNIYQRVNKIMEECDYIKKGSAGQGKGVKYDDVIAMLRSLLIKHGVVMVTHQVGMECLGNVGETKQKIYQGNYLLRLVNMDKPDDFIEHTCVGQGMDAGDKGPGKAHTYAMKVMLVKGFGIETGEDEESRAEKQEKLNVISADEYAQLAVYCVDPAGGSWSETGTALMGAYKLSGIQNLPASKFVEALKRAKSHADNK
tara:strand:+ start:35888 stop:36493 length:606 start_codon:yes stop_codon:yes gene_type:complete